MTLCLSVPLQSQQGSLMWLMLMTGLTSLDLIWWVFKRVYWMELVLTKNCEHFSLFVFFLCFWRLNDLLTQIHFVLLDSEMQSNKNSWREKKRLRALSCVFTCYKVRARRLHLGIVMWMPRSWSRRSLLKATSCRWHLSNSERLCSGMGFTSTLRPDTLLQVKSPWGHTHTHAKSHT